MGVLAHTGPSCEVQVQLLREEVVVDWVLGRSALTSDYVTIVLWPMPSHGVVVVHLIDPGVSQIIPVGSFSGTLPFWLHL